VQSDGAEHCYNDSPAANPNSPLHWVPNTNIGEFSMSGCPHNAPQARSGKPDHLSHLPKCMSPHRPWGSEIPRQSARSSMACLRNSIAAGDWSGNANDTSVPAITGMTVEAYIEEFTWPASIPYANLGYYPGGAHWPKISRRGPRFTSDQVPAGRGGTRKPNLQFPTDGFSFGLNSDMGPITDGWVHEFPERPPQCTTFRQIGRQEHDGMRNVDDIRRFSAYPQGCRANDPEADRWGGWARPGSKKCPVDEKVPCCPYRHIHTKMVPVKVQNLRMASVVDMQTGGIAFRSMAQGQRADTQEATCYSTQGALSLSFWYKPSDPKGECRE